jgi:hypothetical protein
LWSPPTKREDKNAPQRVQTAVSPRRTQHQIHTAGKKYQPDMQSHHKTPHVMGFLSAGQQYNLSQDVMAETISQANNCFSTSTHPKNQNSKTSISSKETIIFSEMVNALIFPETGRSLKHQELITKLRNKIKWMRYIANEINRLYNTNPI